MKFILCYSKNNSFRLVPMMKFCFFLQILKLPKFNFETQYDNTE